MKIMKVLGVVVGIHVFALMLIFANPGCTSTSKPTPAPSDTVAKSEPAPAVSLPGLSPAPGGSPVSAAPIAFNPDAPATVGDGIRFTPTRPGTAAAATLVAEPVADVTPTTTYTVKSGDNLWIVAKRNHLSYTELAAANNLKSNANLHEGQKLLIPGKPVAHTAPAVDSATAAKTAVPAAAKPSADAVKHIVKSGESLSMIAKQYGVKQGDIAVANNITDPQKIRAGMELTIPGWQATSAKAAKPAGKSGAGSTAAKPAAAADSKPLFNAPGGTQVPVIGPNAGAAPTSDVPVIKVDEAPAAPKQP